MKTRDEYVAKLKARLDQWNAEAARWETQANAAKAKQMQAFRDHREQAMYNLKLLEGASATAWKEFTKGADEAWDRLQESFTQASKHFAKEPPAKPRK